MLPSRGHASLVQPRQRSEVTEPILPLLKSHRKQLTAQRRVPAKDADRVKTTAAVPNAVPSADAPTASSAVSSSASGYSVAPIRGDMPPASSPGAIYPTSRSTPVSLNSIRKISKRTAAESQPPAPQHSPNNPQHQAHDMSRSKPSRRNKQSAASCPPETNTTTSRSRNNPAKAFMHAGMPPGLWVLPMDLAVDAPPAPPPVAPEDPQQLLQVLQAMPAPRRRVVIFKAGGYVYSDMEALITDSGLGHVLRLTNLIRKAHCVLAKPVWENGKHVNLQEHQSAARKAKVPFLTINKLDAVQLVEALRPVLLKKKIVIECKGC